MQRMGGLPNRNIRITSEEAGMHAKSCLGEKTPMEETKISHQITCLDHLDERKICKVACMYDKTSSKDPGVVTLNDKASMTVVSTDAPPPCSHQ